MSMMSRRACPVILVGVLLAMSSCATSPTPSEQQLHDEQTRFDQQQKKYPDKESREQQKAEADRARKEDMLKK